MRRVGLRTVPPADHSAEPGYREWKAGPLWGECACCGDRGRLERHHVIAAQHVKAIDPSKVWDLRNSLLLGVHCRCHSRHTNAAARLPRSCITPQARQFAIDLLGAERMELYLDRFYAPG